jgi:hypothetical protein
MARKPHSTRNEQNGGDLGLISTEQYRRFEKAALAPSLVSIAIAVGPFRSALAFTKIAKEPHLRERLHSAASAQGAL